MKRGVYIAFEGIDGSGKTTVSHLTCDLLRVFGIHVLELREPTNVSAAGVEIRRLVSDPEGAPDMGLLLDLFMEDRQCMAPIIEKHLSDGGVVITDRSYISSAAYQAHGEWTPERIIERAEGLVPPLDGLLYLRVSLSVAKERRGGGARDALEKNLAPVAKRYGDIYTQRWMSGRSAFAIDADYTSPHRAAARACEYVLRVYEGRP